MSDSLKYVPLLSEEEYHSMVSIKKRQLDKARLRHMTLTEFIEKSGMECPTKDCSRCYLLFPARMEFEKTEPCPCIRYNTSSMIRRGNKLIQKFKQVNGIT